MKTGTPAFIVGNAFCFISTVLIACQVYRSPKKLRIFIGIFSLLTLPCSIVDTLTFESIISDRWNSLTYLISTFLMMTMHFAMTLDMGFQLRAENASWKHWQVVIGIGGVAASNICILVQIGILGANPLDQFPYKPAFILGVCLACVGDSSVMYYAFAPLVRRKKNRTQPIHSKTTAYGVWFLGIEVIFYTLYGTLYLWFFIANTWDNLTILLALDYIMRFFLCLCFTWPPPNRIIDSLARQFSSHNDSGLHTNSVPGGVRTENAGPYRRMSSGTMEPIELKDNKIV